MTSDPNNSIQVRRAAIEHLNSIIDFNIAMAKETEDKDLDIELVQPGVEAVLTRTDLGFYLIAEHSGRAAGQMMITYEWSDWRNAYFWWIQSVYVKPEFRRQGLYSALHLYAATEARRQGNVRGLRLYVDKENTVAQGVYAGLHMHPTNYDMYEIDFEGGSDERRP